MHVRMLCLGRHWNGKTYAYEPTRTDYDNLPAPPLPDDVPRARARDRARRRHAARRRSLHPELLRCRRPHGAASGQGRERAIARGRPARGVDVARRHRAVPVRRPEAARIRSSRGCSSPATRLCSAARRACGITASRGSCPAPRRRSSICGPIQPDVPSVRPLTVRGREPFCVAPRFPQGVGNGFRETPFPTPGGNRRSRETVPDPLWKTGQRRLGRANFGLNSPSARKRFPTPSTRSGGRGLG